MSIVLPSMYNGQTFCSKQYYALIDQLYKCCRKEPIVGCEDLTELEIRMYEDALLKILDSHPLKEFICLTVDGMLKCNCNNTK